MKNGLISFIKWIRREKPKEFVALAACLLLIAAIIAALCISFPAARFLFAVVTVTVVVFGAFAVIFSIIDDALYDWKHR